MSNKEYNITHTQMGGGELKEDVGGGSAALTPATANALGGVKIGNGISVTEDGTISAQGGGSEPEIVVLAKAMGTKIGDTIVITLTEEQFDIENPPIIYYMSTAPAVLTPCKTKMDTGDGLATVVVYNIVTGFQDNDARQVIYVGSDNAQAGMVIEGYSEVMVYITETETE